MAELARTTRGEGDDAEARLPWLPWFDVFLDALSMTPNVVKAAKAAEKTPQVAYWHKLRKPAFREAWERALGVSFEILRAKVADVALHGSEECEYEVIDGERTLVRVRTRFEPRLALSLLQAHDPLRFNTAAAVAAAAQAKASDPSQDFRSLLERIDGAVPAPRATPDDSGDPGSAGSDGA